MNSIRFRSLVPAALVLSYSLQAQNVLISVRAPSEKVMVAGTVRLNATITAVDGTPLDPSTLTWQSWDEKVASVAQDGTAKGLAPGLARVGVTDSQTGVTAWVNLHIVPASLSLTVSAGLLLAGDTAQLTPTALDAAGKPIAGLRYHFVSSSSSVATVGTDGVVTGQGEGVATLRVALLGAPSDPGLIATTQVRVLPKPRYKLTKMVASTTTAPTTIAAVTALSAVSSNEIGAVLTLANGGQAAVVIEGGRQRVLAVAGQPLANTGRMVLRIDGISTNTRGDTALLIEYPSQWCNASVFLFPKGQPATEIAAANCNNGLSPHSLADDGSVLYRFNDQIWSAPARSAPVMLFSIATQPGLPDAIRSLNNFTAGGGAYIIGASLASGATGYFWSDGRTLTRVYRSGDQVRGPSTSIDTPVASASGLFYARANGPSYSSLVQLGSFGLKTLVSSGDDIVAGKLGWVQPLADVNADGVLFAADFNVPSNYHTGIALWKAGVTTEVAPCAGYGAMVAGALPSDGIPVVSAALKDESKIPGLRSLPLQQDARFILEAGANFSQPAPSAVDWHYASRGGTGSTMAARSAGEAVVVVDNTGVHTIASVGSTLPNGSAAVWIGGTVSNSAGDLVFTAGYATGSLLVRWHGGRLETLADNSATGGTNPYTRPSWLNSYRGRYLAANNRGDVVHISSYQNGSMFYIVIIAGGVPKLVAAQNTASPSGAAFSNFNSVAVDENGRVLFVASTSDGKTGVYFWDGTSVQKVIATGDSTSTGTVNEVSNIAGGGSGFLIMLALDNYRARELRYFDGRLRTLESTDTSLLDGTWMNYFWMNEATLGGNGDAHYQVQTQDASAGVYARRADGSLAIVARSRDPLPGGEWLIFPLTVSSAASGEVWFTAYTWKDGIESLSLYLGTPQ